MEQSNTPTAVGSNAGLGAAPFAQLEWGLHVRCPKCQESNDLSQHDHDSEYNIARAIFSNAWDKLRGWEVTCAACGHEFLIAGAVY